MKNNLFKIISALLIVSMLICYAPFINGTNGNNQVLCKNADAASKIPSDAVKFKGHYYKVFPNNTVNTWEEAKAYCENLGGCLAVINSKAENDFLYNYIISMNIQSAYFGYSDSANEGEWKWVNNKKSTYTNWNQSEPNSESSTEDYAEFYWKYTSGTWNDGNFNHGTASDGNAFICEWGASDTIISSIVPADAVKFKGHYYKVFPNNTVSTWEAAKSYCENLKGYLAVINSKAENDFLYNYIISMNIQSAYFGYSDSANEGEWKWVNNKKSTYTNWNQSEPNSESSTEDYAEFYWKYTSGTWNDGNFNHGTASDGNAFICEWDTLTPAPKIKSVTLSKTKLTYTGKALKPTVIVKDINGKVVKTTNYTVTYKNNTNVGKATVTVKFKGNYSGTKTLTFKINPKVTTVSKVTSTKKGTATVTVKKQATQTTGYEIQYSTSSKFTAKTTKTVKITSAKTLTKTISKLTSGKTYYFRVRTYKTVSKTNYYSAWSGYKSVKIK